MKVHHTGIADIELNTSTGEMLLFHRYPSMSKGVTQVAPTDPGSHLHHLYHLWLILLQILIFTSWVYWATLEILQRHYPVEIVITLMLHTRETNFFLFVCFCSQWVWCTRYSKQLANTNACCIGTNTSYYLLWFEILVLQEAVTGLEEIVCSHGWNGTELIDLK